MEDFISHNVIYSLDELKKLIISKGDAEILHKIKRFMYKITCKQNLPGEIFRKYPKNIKYAYVNFRPFLESEEFKNYNIEISNYGRIKINNSIEPQVEEKEGWFYIKTKKIYYPVYRFVAEVWCECSFEDSSSWQVHHLSNDGNNNTPENLIWIKDVSHNFIPKYALDRINNYVKDKIVETQTENEEINKIIEIINTY
ncbi:hypothetical protein FACS189485_19090 [Spirochaetia bacterium]|nr:hypothetical protein FACS189485_19090 [Spirochaetia bacterium]